MEVPGMCATKTGTITSTTCSTTMTNTRTTAAGRHRLLLKRVFRDGNEDDAPCHGGRGWLTESEGPAQHPAYHGWGSPEDSETEDEVSLNGSFYGEWAALVIDEDRKDGELPHQQPACEMNDTQQYQGSQESTSAASSEPVVINSPLLTNVRETFEATSCMWPAFSRETSPEDGTTEVPSVRRRTGRRPRSTAWATLTPHQKDVLTKAFQDNVYVGLVRHHVLSSELGVPASVIKDLFAKWRTKCFKKLRQSGQEGVVEDIRRISYNGINSIPPRAAQDLSALQLGPFQLPAPSSTTLLPTHHETQQPTQETNTRCTGQQQQQQHQAPLDHSAQAPTHHMYPRHPWQHPLHRAHTQTFMNHQQEQNQDAFLPQQTYPAPPLHHLPSPPLHPLQWSLPGHFQSPPQQSELLLQHAAQHEVNYSQQQSPLVRDDRNLYEARVHWAPQLSINQGCLPPMSAFCSTQMSTRSSSSSPSAMSIGSSTSSNFDAPIDYSLQQQNLLGLSCI